MNKKQKLNSLVVRYNIEGDENAFNDAYRMITAKLTKRVYFYANRTGASLAEVEEVIDHAIFKSVRAYKEGTGDYENLLERTLSNMLKDLRRKIARLEKRFILDNDEKLSIFENYDLLGDAIADNDFENEIATSLDKRQKEKEQRQLFQGLHANVDNFSQDVLTVLTGNQRVFKSDNSVNVLAIAKLLETNSNKVSRSLERINNAAKRLFKIEDYLSA